MTKKVPVKKLPRLPNKVNAKKVYTPAELEVIKNSGSQYDKQVLAKLTELGGDGERLLHVLRFKLRGLSRAEIACAVGVSVATIEKDIATLNKQLRTDVADFDFPLFLGQTMAFFDECRNSAMAIYDNTDNPEAIRLGALKTAMGAETDKVNLLARVGLFENQPTVFVPDSETSKETDGEQFQKFMKVVAEGYEQKNNAGKNFH